MIGKVESFPSKADQAYDLVVDAVATGELPFDEPLSANEISSQIEGLTRTPLREALIILEARGLGETRRNRGFSFTTVTEKDITDRLEVIHPIRRLAVHKMIEPDGIPLPVEERRTPHLKAILSTLGEIQVDTVENDLTQDDVLKLDAGLNNAINKDGGIRVVERAIETYGVARRFYHAQRPLTANGKLSVVVAGLELATGLLQAPDFGIADRALQEHYYTEKSLISSAA